MSAENKPSPVLVLVCVACIGFAVWWFLSGNSSQDVATTDYQAPIQEAPKASEVSNSQPEYQFGSAGDTDSPNDTIRRLQANANKAAKEAQQANNRAGDIEASTQAQIDEIKASISNNKESDIYNQTVEELKTQLETLTTLFEGRLLEIQKQQQQASYDVGDPNEWVTVSEPQEIQGVNQLIAPNSFSSELEEPQTVFPIATIPENSPLLGSITLSTVVGRIPRGGSVFESYNFYVETGSNNFASQGHSIPYLEKAIWRGIASGDKDLRCARGKVVSVTFIFTDGRIHTVSNKDKPLGELITPYGSNCLPGKFINNTQKYIAMLGGAGFLSGVGQAASDAQTQVTSAAGSTVSAITGDAFKAAAGKGVSTAANTAARLIEQEYNDSYASVVIPSGQQVGIIALSQINIDYDTAGRYISHWSEYTNDQ